MRKTLMRACRSPDDPGGLCSLEGTGAVKGGVKSEDKGAATGAASLEPGLIRSISRRVAVRGD
jgi:hypothetical protein